MHKEQLAKLRLATEEDVEEVLWDGCCVPEPRSPVELLEFFNCMLDRLIGETDD
jgi:hypothetical protein